MRGRGSWLAGSHSEADPGPCRGCDQPGKVSAQVQSGDYSRVVLRPLMIVAGDHANNDMAGDEEDSWKSIFEGAGYEVECVVEGLGQLEAIQKLILAHAADAISQVK